MIAVLVAIGALLVFECLAWRYGADSRDGKDWAVSRTTADGSRLRADLRAERLS